MNSGFFIAFSSSNCIGFVGVSGAIFCLAFLGFWRVDEDNTPSKKGPIYRPNAAEPPVETIGDPTMTYISPSQYIRSPLYNCGCVVIKLRGVGTVATVHTDQILEHYDTRDTST